MSLKNQPSPFLNLTTKLNETFSQQDRKMKREQTFQLKRCTFFIFIIKNTEHNKLFVQKTNNFHLF